MSQKHLKLGSELGVSLAVLIVLALLISPYWMPMGVVVLCLAVLAALVFGLGVFVWRETPRDEREQQVMAQAGRSAYLLGAAILTAGVVVQTLQHSVDVWLVLALAGMVLAKVLSTSAKD
jgi:Na+-transporting methylmalonyl-CoA/oxaloacetate decarboxylase gamma subunit